MSRKFGWMKPRFSLWAMLVLITVAAIPLSYVAQRRSFNLRRAAAYEELLANGISLKCHYSRVLPSQRFSDRAWLWLTLDDSTPPVTEATDQPFPPNENLEALTARKPEGLELMRFFPDLESIDLSGWDELTDDHLGFLKELPFLSSFSIANSPRVRGHFLTVFPATGKLETLELRGMDALEAQHLGVLKELPLLEGLVLADCAQLDDSTLKGVNLPPRIEYLELAGRFGDETATRWLGQCRLKHLTIDLPITKQTTAVLQSQITLETLSIRNAPLCDEDFAFLKECEQLMYLRLEALPIRGPFLKWLSHPEELSFLSLAFTLFSDEHLPSLARFEELFEVDLACTPISGEGFSKMKDQFGHVKFKLWGTRLSTAGKIAFAEAIKSTNKTVIWLPSDWRASDMELLAHSPVTRAECQISMLATYDPQRKGILGDTYLPDAMLPGGQMTPLDRCPEELMAPVIRLQEAAERDADWLRRRINGSDEELPPDYVRDGAEASDGN